MLDFLRSPTASVKEYMSAETTNEIVDTLNRFRDSCCKVSVQFAGENVSYTCNMSAFNLKHNVIVISNLCPEIPMTSLRKGNAVSVAVHERGGVTNFECSYLEPLIENQNTALQLKLPKNFGVRSKKNLHYLLDGIQGEKLKLSKHGLK